MQAKFISERMNFQKHANGHKRPSITIFHKFLLPSKGHNCDFGHLRVRPLDGNRGRVTIQGPLPSKGLHKAVREGLADRMKMVIQKRIIPARIQSQDEKVSNQLTM